MIVMYRRILFRSIFVTLILLLSISLLINPIYSASATIDGPSTLLINIESPVNKIYNQNSILINVTFHTQPGETRDSYVAYSIFNENVKYTSGLLYDGPLSKSEPIWRSELIEEITDGEYTLEVTGRHRIDPGGIQEADQDFVEFIIATESPSPTPTPTDTPTPEPFPTTLVVASIATIAVIGLGILVYFKKLRS